LGTVRAVAGLGGATPAEAGHISFYGLACGPDGVDASDGLTSWEEISTVPF